MINLPAEPLFFKPIYFEKIWGGNTLQGKFNRPIASGKLIGESWELSGLESTQSVVSSGKIQGVTLGQLAQYATEPLTGNELLQNFPLLVKFIDATERLSVQVHPGYENAKTECWYVVDAQKDAKLVTGFSSDVTRETVLSALETKSLPSILNEVTIKSGEMYFIPSGTVHAIIGNCLIYEVQQSSDTTYRLYDWDRLDSSNQPRELHISQALDSLDMSGNLSYRIDPIIFEHEGYVHSLRLGCRHFAMEEFHFLKRVEIKPYPRKSFRILTVFDGVVTVRYGEDQVVIEKGKTALIPYLLNDISFEAEAGSTIVATFIPNLISDIIEPLVIKKVSKEKIMSLGGGPLKNNDIRSLLMGETLLKR
jgi:mannose-6-phosphate isomerase